MAAKALPDAEYLRNRFAYDPETGVLTWKPKDGSRAHDARWNVRWAGKPAGSDMLGYTVIRLDFKRYKAHRLIWVIMTGEEPDYVDHINGDRADNRWSNLRNVSHKENNKNQKRYITNKSGHTGVRRHSNADAWVAEITINNRTRYLGLFKSLEDACAARKDAQKKHGFHQNHGRA